MRITQQIFNADLFPFGQFFRDTNTRRIELSMPINTRRNGKKSNYAVKKSIK